MYYLQKNIYIWNYKYQMVVHIDITSPTFYFRPWFHQAILRLGEFQCLNFSLWYLITTVFERIRDGAKLFASVKERKLQCKDSPVYSIYTLNSIALNTVL